MTIRALIVDDEALGRERVRSLLSAHPDVVLAGECAGGKEAIEAVSRLRPDLVFLDIQMPDVDGFEVLEALGGDELPAVVFVTAYDEYALRAFEVHALDYLLKPIDPQRFQAALARAIGAVRSRQGAAADPRLTELLAALSRRESRLDRLVVRSGGKVFFLRPADIDWIEADGKYARLHVGRESYPVRQPLKDLADRLRPAGFVRIHRSAIVNLDRVRELEPWFHGEFVVILRDGTRLTSSAAFSADLHRLVVDRI